MTTDNNSRFEPFPPVSLLSEEGRPDLDYGIDLCKSSGRRPQTPGLYNRVARAVCIH